MSSNAIDSANPAASSSETSRQAQPDRIELKGTDKLEMLTTALEANSIKKQLQAVRDLSALGRAGEPALADFVRRRMDPKNPAYPTAAHGSAYQSLYNQGTSAAAKAVIQALPHGLVCPRSAKGIDYGELQKLLVRREYQRADKLTNQKLCELAGESAIARKWIYFTEVENFPVIDLTAMDVMWGLYSDNKFGWSKQHALWTRLSQNWERLWPQLNWKTGNSWTRYPNEFTWDLSAPEGHLPLSNQLRGVRTMSSLLSHPAWGQPGQGS
ncbi:MAG: GUN4 N-terminal ARM-like repeat domain-containing protein [Phormidesmis sp.]